MFSPRSSQLSPVVKLRIDSTKDQETKKKNLSTSSTSHIMNHRNFHPRQCMSHDNSYVISPRGPPSYHCRSQIPSIHGGRTERKRNPTRESGRAKLAWIPRGSVFRHLVPQDLTWASGIGSRRSRISSLLLLPAMALPFQLSDQPIEQDEFMRRDTQSRRA